MSSAQRLPELLTCQAEGRVGAAAWTGCCGRLGHRNQGPACSVTPPRSKPSGTGSAVLVRGFTPAVQPVTPTVCSLKAKQLLSSLSLSGIHPPCRPAHANKTHRLFTAAHSSCRAAPTSKADGTSLHTLRPTARTHAHQFLSSSTRPVSSLSPTPGSIKASHEAAEVPLPRSLSHRRLPSCPGFTSRDFLPQTCRDAPSSVYIATRADGAPESRSTSLGAQSVLLPLPSVFPAPLTAAQASFFAPFLVGRTCRAPPPASPLPRMTPGDKARMDPRSLSPPPPISAPPAAPLVRLNDLPPDRNLHRC